MNVSVGRAMRTDHGERTYGQKSEALAQPPVPCHREALWEFYSSVRCRKVLLFLITTVMALKHSSRRVEHRA